MITRNTRVLVQGMTGRLGSMHTRLMRAYGTNIVAGVGPRNEPLDGIPVFPTCAEAVAATGAEAAIAFVAAANLLGAIREAAEAGLRLIVTPSEGFPVHDALKAREVARAAGVTWIGASTPGIAVPGEAKMGFLPDASLTPGPVGIMSKSGILSYEIGNRLVQAGLGQSIWVGVGGDPVKGTCYADLIPLYAADARTEAIVLIGEVGGHEEEEFAAALTGSGFDKPVFAAIAGRSAREGVVMGHAGAIVNGTDGNWDSKAKALRAAGVSVHETVGQLVQAVRAAL